MTSLPCSLAIDLLSSSDRTENLQEGLSQRPAAGHSSAFELESRLSLWCSQSLLCACIARARVSQQAL